MTTSVSLMQYARGAGCGCKISPRQLEEILKSNLKEPFYEKLLVGNSSKDDAAVYDLGNGTALISTTDFFTPVTDDPFDFGRIAAANALSDVYAMGGTPLMALAILGWPVERLPLQPAQAVLEGARTVCEQAGIPLAGGHSVDTAEPLFGLAVTGQAGINHIKKNNTAREGDVLILTKPIGTGILSSAAKRGAISKAHQKTMISLMTQLNREGEALGKSEHVHAMTDVTGFGLLGHLVEMAEGSGLTALLYYDNIPVAEGVKEYLAQKMYPDATPRNWSSYAPLVSIRPGIHVAEAFLLLPDPQTNGGLLISVAEEGIESVEKIIGKACFVIGKMTSKKDKTIQVL
ncbi:MAG: selenide, water dikinase SelD [Chitinophagaceae bacterium]|nr:selenide, water dikinase SelD [Chitinophagaceae bacterium]